MRICEVEECKAKRQEVNLDIGVRAAMKRSLVEEESLVLPAVVGF